MSNTPVPKRFYEPTPRPTESDIRWFQDRIDPILAMQAAKEGPWGERSPGKPFPESQVNSLPDLKWGVDRAFHEQATGGLEEHFNKANNAFMSGLALFFKYDESRVLRREKEAKERYDLALYLLLKTPEKDRWAVYRHYPELKYRQTKWERLWQSWKEYWNPKF